MGSASAAVVAVRIVVVVRIVGVVGHIVVVGLVVDRAIDELGLVVEDVAGFGWFGVAVWIVRSKLMELCL